MKTVYLFQCLLLILCMGLVGCQDDDSPAEGPQGEQGPAGEDGQDGEDGEDGNANVIASEWIVEQFTDDFVTGTYFDVEDKNINQEILDSGVFLAYGKYLDSSYILPLPTMLDNKYYYSYMYTGRVRFGGNAMVEGTLEFYEFTHFRYIIIPSSATSGKNTSVDFHAMSYGEVMDYFDLEP